jgi:hypothetical protein
MKLIRDERAYRRVLENFLGGRSNALVFISQFSHLWLCDGAVCQIGGRMALAPDSQPGFYGLMDTINSLCQQYANCLGDGCGYRVSEEQFRKEVETLMGAPARPCSARAE